jgi:EutQ-like cupin domain
MSRRAVLCDGEGIQSGLSRFTEVIGPVQWTLPGRETFLVLEGAARIEIDDGQVLELTAGDIASLPAGARTRSAGDYVFLGRRLLRSDGGLGNSHADSIPAPINTASKADKPTRLLSSRG